MNFSGAVFAHGHGHGAHQAFVAIVLVFQMRTFCVHKFHHEFKNGPRGAKATSYGKRQCDDTNKMRMRGEDVADAAKPGEKGHNSRSVEPGDVACAMGRSGLGDAAVRMGNAAVGRAMKGHVHLERQVDVNSRLPKTRGR